MRAKAILPVCVALQYNTQQVMPKPGHVVQGLRAIEPNLLNKKRYIGRNRDARSRTGEPLTTDVITG